MRGRRRAGSLGPTYRKLWGASAVSNLGDGIFQLALPLLAVELTRSPSKVAGVLLANKLPWIFMTLLAGALADRLDRKRTMVGVGLVRAVVIGVLALAAFTDNASLPLLYVLAFVLGIGETLFDTAAQSVMPAVVARDQLSRANSRLFGAELVANQFVGPPLGGLLAALAIGAAFAVTSGGYLVAAALLSTMVGSFRPERAGPRTSIRTDIREGVRYVWHQPVLRTLALMLGISNLAATAQQAVIVLYVVDPGPVGLSEASFGVLYTTSAVGGLAGTWLSAPAERVLGRATVLFLSMAVGTVALAVPAITANVIAIGASFVAFGAISVLWNVITVSLRQRITPDRLLGRMNSVYRLMGWGTMPLGALLAGVLGDAFGLRTVFWVSAAINASLLLGFLVVNERSIAASEAAAVERAAQAKNS